MTTSHAVYLESGRAQRRGRAIHYVMHAELIIRKRVIHQVTLRVSYLCSEELGR